MKHLSPSHTQGLIGVSDSVGQDRPHAVLHHVLVKAPEVTLATDDAAHLHEAANVLQELVGHARVADGLGVAEAAGPHGQGAVQLLQILLAEVVQVLELVVAPNQLRVVGVNLDLRREAVSR